MKKLLLTILIIILYFSAIAQDTTDVTINPNWVNPEEIGDTVEVAKMTVFPEISEIVDRIVPNWIAPDNFFEPDQKQLTDSDVKALQEDVKFLDDLPSSYQDIPKEDLQKVMAQIDNKINQLKAEIAELLAARNSNQEVLKTKQSTLTVLEKEKSVIALTVQSGDLLDANGNLIGQNDELKVEQDRLKKYLYFAIGGLAALMLITAVVLQRRRIQVQDVEIEEQLNDINKKNSYLEHAARIIRHDMHSGINTYMPRGISSLEKRLTEEDIKRLKIELPLKMVKDGLTHTQRVYKSVYEFTNLVKKSVVLNKTRVNLKDLITNYISNNPYRSQVLIEDLGDLEVNETLFCNAIENLIKNGLAYNDSESKEVKIYLEEGSIIVEDNGVGFSQKKFEKHLKKYANSAGAEDEKGLGLNICVAILEEHGFKLTCDETETGTKMKIKINN